MTYPLKDSIMNSQDRAYNNLLGDTYDIQIERNKDLSDIYIALRFLLNLLRNESKHIDPIFNAKVKLDFLFSQFNQRDTKQIHWIT